MQVAFALTSSPGVPLEANWNIPNAVARQWLGRDLAGSAPNIAVNLLAPDQMRSDRINILDFRIGKVMRFGGQRALVALDLFNALNLDTVLVNNFTYRPARCMAGSAGGADGEHGEDHRAVPISDR